jgi:hypothetical protein
MPRAASHWNAAGEIWLRRSRHALTLELDALRAYGIDPAHLPLANAHQRAHQAGARVSRLERAGSRAMRAQVWHRTGWRADS